MNKLSSLFLTIALLVGAFSISPPKAFATADVLVRNTGGFFVKNGADSKYYPAEICYTTDGAQGFIPCREGSYGLAPGYLDSSSTNIPSNTNGSFATVIASTAVASTNLSVYNGTAQAIDVAVGAAGFEIEKLLVAPSQALNQRLFLPSATRLSVKSKATTVSSGLVLINLQ